MVVNFGEWKVKVHRRDCLYYRSSRLRPVSPGMEIVACGKCRPTEEEVESVVPLLTMAVHAHGFAGRRVVPLELPDGA